MADEITTDRCSSCGIRLVDRGCTSFVCPSCGQTAIGRCINCKDQSTKYVCKECGFEGP